MMVERMVARGYERDFAQRCFDQIKGFGSYGFPESHAASFAKLVYISSWLKCHHPAAFACALLNAQPMGFYAPAQIVREAQEIGGVEPRAIDVNFSFWDNGLEPTVHSRFALRLGFRQIDGFREEWGLRIAARRGGGYADVEELMRRADLPGRAMRLLADADAFRSLGLDRREALWAVRRLPDDEALPLFAAAQARELGEEPAVPLPLMPLTQQIVADYQTVRLSLKGHPMGMLRPLFRRDRVLSCAELDGRPDGSWAATAGVVLVHHAGGRDRHRQHPALGAPVRALPARGDERAPAADRGPGAEEPRGRGPSHGPARRRPHGRSVEPVGEPQRHDHPDAGGRVQASPGPAWPSPPRRPDSAEIPGFPLTAAMVVNSPVS